MFSRSFLDFDRFRALNGVDTSPPPLTVIVLFNGIAHLLLCKHLSSQRSRVRFPVLPSCDWFSPYKSEVTGSIPGASKKFRIVRIIIPACLGKQPNGTHSSQTLKILSGALNKMS